MMQTIHRTTVGFLFILGCGREESPEPSAPRTRDPLYASDAASPTDAGRTGLPPRDPAVAALVEDTCDGTPRCPDQRSCVSLLAFGVFGERCGSPPCYVCFLPGRGVVDLPCPAGQKPTASSFAEPASWHCGP